MKYLIVAAVLALAYWIWRKNRTNSANFASPNKSHTKKNKSIQPQLMISCATCGVLLPQAEAVTGLRGVYCCAEHLRQKEA